MPTGPAISYEGIDASRVVALESNSVSRRGGPISQVDKVPYLNVRDFGAVGIGASGAVADTAGFQAAIAAAAVTNSNVAVYVPVSTSYYSITATLATFPGLTIIGDASQRPSDGGTEVRCSVVGPLFQMGTDDGLAHDRAGYDGPEGFTLKNIYFKANTTTATLDYNGTSVYCPGTYGVQDWRGGDVTMDNVFFEAFDYWFWGIQSDLNTFRKVEVRNCKHGFYLGPRSDQNTFYDFYPTLNDKVGTIDCARGTTFYSPKFVGNGTTTVNPITITNISTVTSLAENIVMYAPWLEHFQGAAHIEAFVEVGIGDTTTVAGVELHDAAIFTNAQGGGSPYAQYIFKTDNANLLRLSVSAPTKFAALAAVIENVGTFAPSAWIEHCFVARGNTVVTTPVVNTSSGVCDPLLIARGATQIYYSLSASGAPLVRYARLSNTVAQLEINTSGQLRWSSGSASVDCQIGRLAVGVLGFGIAQNVFRGGSGTTAQRPGPTTAGVGATYFDTTLGYLIASNGTNWVNSIGVSV